MTSSVGSTCTICDRKPRPPTQPTRRASDGMGDEGGRASRGGRWGAGQRSPGRPGTRPQTPSPFRHPSPFILVDMRELSTADPSAGREGVATITHPLRVVGEEWAYDGQWLEWLGGNATDPHLASPLALNGLQGFYCRTLGIKKPRAPVYRLPNGSNNDGIHIDLTDRMAVMSVQTAVWAGEEEAGAKKPSEPAARHAAAPKRARRNARHLSLARARAQAQAHPFGNYRRRLRVGEEPCRRIYAHEGSHDVRYGATDERG